MRILIIGGGVIGATSAYWLAKAGHSVELIEQEAEGGHGVSAGNGGQLSYAYVEPLAGPDLWAKFPAILLGLDSAVRIRPRLSADALGWTASFLGHCFGGRQRATLSDLLLLAGESRAAMAELLSDAALDFDHGRRGKLILYRDSQALDGAGALAEIKRAHGFKIEVLDRARCLALDPALSGYGNPFAGGVYAPEDESGDCGKFTRALLAHAEARLGVELHTSTRVLRLNLQDGKVCGVDLSPNGHMGGTRQADAVVLAAGIDAPRLAATIGLALPIQPVKGYSITAPARDAAPQVSLTDRGEKIVFARLGDRLRAAAFADLDGWSPAVKPDRAASLLVLVRKLFPEGADWDAATPIWAGQRPMTPSGRPLIGASARPGLYLNAGHGGLGWTLACGAAKRLARIFEK
ncbi:MAG TPA: FAD-dependent oxidoreductase [Alphaproteobacteria bacterium]|nr:FAD-dependent oxidoreductase [Alphaproteobacteria bacterium]